MVLKERMMNNEIKCQICNMPLNETMNRCPNCGWIQELDIDSPDDIQWSYNFVSYNKAKKLFKDGKPLLPDFGDLLDSMKIYSEIEFYVGEIHLGIVTTENGQIHFYKWNNTESGYQVYASIDEFAVKANINGILLKECWHNLKEIRVAE